MSVSGSALRDRSQIEVAVRSSLAAQPVVDLHTHLYPPGFGTPVPSATHQTDPAGLMLWGIDELVTYHYLVAEVYRVVPPSQLPYEQFWAMSKREQADHIWRHLFVERTPISEACRGVLTSIQKLGLEPGARSLDPYRRWFDAQDPSRYIDLVMEKAGVESITMTNNVFDDNERERWLRDPQAGRDPRFAGVLRIDTMLRDWPTAARRLAAWGYETGEAIEGRTIEEARRFLREWIDRVGAVYCAVSLPPEFRYPAEGGAKERAGQAVLEKIVLPVCEERGLPMAMMIGSRLRVNPALRDAGDMVGLSDVQSIVNLCAAFPQNRFLITMLARENQHQLAVAARKFANLMIFGCWWFLNNPSLIDEITRMRVELLGTSFIPQHSDARILDQLLYKWEHSRDVIASVLTDKYADVARTGWPVTREDIERDARLLLCDNFRDFLKR